MKLLLLTLQDEDLILQIVGTIEQGCVTKLLEKTIGFGESEQTSIGHYWLARLCHQTCTRLKFKVFY